MPEKIVTVNVHGIPSNFAGGGQNRQLALECADYDIRIAVSSAIGGVTTPYITNNEVGVEFISPGRVDGSVICASVRGIPTECDERARQRVVDYVRDQLKSHIGRTAPQLESVTVNAVDADNSVVARSLWGAAKRL